jgi:adenylate cyclase
MQGTRTFLSFGSSWKAEDFHVAQGLFERSFAVDPHYARAYSMLSLMKTIAWANPLHSEFLNPSTRDQAYQLAAQAVRLDENLPQAQTQLGYILTWMRQYDASIAAFERAVLLNPNLTDYRFAGVLTHAGEFERAIDVARVHMRLDPFYSSLAPAWQGLALYMLKRYAEALPCLQQCVARSPNFYGGHVWLAATYAQLDRITDARSEVAESLKIDPKFTIEDRLEIIGASKHERDREHLIDGLRKAGSPEK